LIKLILLFLTIYITIQVGRMIRKGVVTFNVFKSNYSNISQDNPNSTNKIEDAEFEDITDKDE